ncbi:MULTISPECIES: ABC transporter ATP-binding protein [unclassified Salinibacterium]|uniref:ABC transporter ATP-binding protein n=1 Tax=unclassified Salinibacterium TaxID=2632331 RepID=UPI0018CD58E1|nr:MULTISPECIES: ABC transporter ATP-binding protein [unclassified Salinibacterium]MBH0055291.1 ABC transporter ATP-binding protein [Salinibacterium sp. SWN139]MBH0084414.1 ABC transporter ATP-binding protein [Salinibacterium sp. SWN167]
MPLLSLDDVTRSVELPDFSTLEILKGITLNVEVGDHISIVGRSGSGKSTLLNLLGLIDNPTTGRIVFDGEPLEKLAGSKRDRKRGSDVGFIFQQFNLLAGRTALENVMTPLLYASGRQFWRRKAIAAEMLDRVGLGDRMASMPEKLSGGEQQRVAIARALVRSPRLILADEPTGALDVETGKTVMALLDDVAEQSGAALITITHDPNVAALARRHYRLDGGVLEAIDVRKMLAASLPEAAL